MSWVSKAHKKHQVHKLVEQALNSKEYQDARKDDMQQSALRAFCRFCFVACEYLEMKHGYKEKGLHSFLAFAKGRIEEIGEDDKYFTDVAEYYKETYNLDVLEALGMRLKNIVKKQRDFREENVGGCYAERIYKGRFERWDGS